MDEMKRTTELSSDELALERLLDGESQPGDGECISSAMKADPAEAREVTELLMLDDLLRQAADPEPDSFLNGLEERLNLRRKGPIFDRRVRRTLRERAWSVNQKTVAPKRRLAWPVGLAAAAAALIAFVGIWASVRSQTMAVLVNEANAQFAEGRKPGAVRFAKGDYNLQSGAVHLRFLNGADLVIAGPTRFTINNVGEVSLERGHLRAFIPSTAYGFVVSALGTRYRDLGTEFGVFADPEKNHSELHVFSGQVEVWKGAEKQPEVTVNGGESVEVNQGTLREAKPSAPEDYPTADSISLIRWNNWRDQVLATDTNLVVYYPFMSDAKQSRQLKNAVPGHMFGNGEIFGAQWVVGRWPGKQALQFERPGDGVRLEIPGQYEQFTMAAWIKIDRFENTVTTLLASDGWRKGGVWWNLDRKGYPIATWVWSEPKRTTAWVKEAIPDNQWLHWAVTVDCRSGEIRHYLNGKPIAESVLPPASVYVQPGKMWMGRWSEGDRAPQMRDFRGRIDELMVWKGLVPPKRLAEMADIGMPIELPVAAR